MLAKTNTIKQMNVFLTFPPWDTTLSSFSWSTPFSPWLDLFELVRGGGGGGAPLKAVDFRDAGKGIGVLAEKY